MRILFLTPELPHPADSGGTIKTASILGYLKERHQVDRTPPKTASASPEAPENAMPVESDAVFWGLQGPDRRQKRQVCGRIALERRERQGVKGGLNV